VAHDVFISYATSDKAVADAVCSQLESIHRIRCWIAPRDVTPGASWAESIIDALDGSKIMVLIFSSNANASMQIEREVERAVHKGINIIPLRIENTTPTKTLEYFISAPHWLDALSVPLEQHINKLAASVKALLSKHATHGAPPVAPASAAAAAAKEAGVRPLEAIDHATRPRQQNWLVPALAGVVLVAVVIGFALRSRTPSPVASSSGAAPTSVAPSALAPSTPAPSPSTPPATAVDTPAKPAAAAPVAAAPSAAVPVQNARPVSVPAAPAAVPANPKPVTASSASPAAVRNPNLFIEFKNSPSGAISLDVDGEKKWTEKLGQQPGRPSADVTGALNLPQGPHKITVTLMAADGKVRDTESTTVSVDPGVPRTLRIRLSRFRKNLEFQTAVGRPGGPANADASAKPPTEKEILESAMTKPSSGKPAADPKAADPKTKAPAASSGSGK
jgi:hypothetical protein